MRELHENYSIQKTFNPNDNGINECFVLSNYHSSDSKAKIYKIEKNRYLTLDIGIDNEYYKICDICDLKELITTRLHLYISSDSWRDKINGDSISKKLSWEAYSEKIIEESKTL